MTSEPDHEHDDGWLTALGDIARRDDAELSEAIDDSGPFRAIDGAERQSIADAVMALNAPVAEAEPAGARVIPFRPRRRRAALAGAVAMVTALAAAVVLFTLRPSPSMLPTYRLETTAGAQLERGDHEARAVYTPGTRFVFVLRPDTAPSDPVTVDITLSGPDGPVEWSPQIAIGQGGGVKIEGVFADALALPPGGYVATLEVISGDDVRTLEHRFEMRPR